MKDIWTFGSTWVMPEGDAVDFNMYTELQIEYVQRKIHLLIPQFLQFTHFQYNFLRHSWSVQCMITTTVYRMLSSIKGCGHAVEVK